MNTQEAELIKEHQLMTRHATDKTRAKSEATEIRQDTSIKSILDISDILVNCHGVITLMRVHRLVMESLRPRGPFRDQASLLEALKSAEYLARQGEADIEIKPQQEPGHHC